MGPKTNPSLTSKGVSDPLRNRVNLEVFEWFTIHFLFSLFSLLLGGVGRGRMVGVGVGCMILRCYECWVDNDKELQGRELNNKKDNRLLQTFLGGCSSITSSVYDCSTLI